MHGEEHTVPGHQCGPEVHVAEFVVHHPPKHFGEPMVDSSKHAKNRTHAHHDVEVCHHEIRVVHIHVKCRVGQNDACQSPCHKGAHQTNAEQHGWREPQVALP